MYTFSYKNKMELEKKTKEGRKSIYSEGHLCYNTDEVRKMLKNKENFGKTKSGNPVAFSEKKQNSRVFVRCKKSRMRNHNNLCMTTKSKKRCFSANEACARKNIVRQVGMRKGGGEA